MSGIAGFRPIDIHNPPVFPASHHDYAARWAFWSLRIMRRGGFICQPERMDEAMTLLAGPPPADWGQV